MEKKIRQWKMVGRKFYIGIRASFADYTVSLIAIAAATICSAAVDVWSDQYAVVLQRGLVLFCFGAVFTETYFAERKKRKLYALAVAALTAALMAVGTLLEDLAGVDVQVMNLTAGALSELAFRFLYGYLFLAVFGTVYFCFKRSGIGFPEYVLKVFSNLMKALVVFLILTFGVLFITVIVNTLLIDGYYSDLDRRLEILVIGWYLAPMCLSSLRDMSNEPGAFLRTIVKYILQFLSTCGMAIVYLYVVKIVFSLEVPSNELFSIVSALFCFGMPVWLMAEYYMEDTRYDKVFTKLPYAFAPLILLQLYSMIVRIGQYGVTPDRYLGIMLILFEIYTLFIWHFRKEKRERMLSFLCLLAIISVFAPGINMYRVSNLCQQSFLKKYYQTVLDGKALSNLEYDRLSGSYQYLKNQEQTGKVAEQYNITEKNFVERLNEMEIRDGGLSEYDTHEVHCCQMVGELDVGDWQQMNMLNQADCYYNNRSEQPFEVCYPDGDGGIKTVSCGCGYDLDFSAFQFVKRETDEIITVDISDFAWKCMLYEIEHPDADSTQIQDAVQEYNRIQIDENTVLVLNHFEIRYSEGVRYGEPYFEWFRPTISGVLLTR